MDIIDNIYKIKGHKQYRRFNDIFNEYFDNYLMRVAEYIAGLSLEKDLNYFNKDQITITTFILSNYMEEKELSILSINEDILLKEYFKNYNITPRDYIKSCGENELKVLGLKNSNIKYIEKIVAMNINNKDKADSIVRYLNSIIIPRKKEKNREYRNNESDRYYNELKILFGKDNKVSKLLFVGYSIGEKDSDRKMLEKASDLEFSYKLCSIREDIKNTVDFNKKYGLEETNKLISYLNIYYNNEIVPNNNLNDNYNTLKTGYKIGTVEIEQDTYKNLKELDNRIEKLYKITRDVKYFINNTNNIKENNYVLKQIKKEISSSMSLQDKIRYVQNSSIINNILIYIINEFNNIIEISRLLPRSGSRSYLMLFINKEKKEFFELCEKYGYTISSKDMKKELKIND